MQNYKKEIIGYPNYTITIDGDVFNINTNKKVSVSVHKHGHHVVRLWNNNKTKLFNLYRLLAIHFVPNPDNKPQVNHIDGNRMNYDINNLEWVTASENMKHAYKNKLSKGTYEKGYAHKKCRMNEDKLNLIFEKRKEGNSLKQIASLTGYNPYYISKILNGKVYGKVFSK